MAELAFLWTAGGPNGRRSDTTVFPVALPVDAPAVAEVGTNSRETLPSTVVSRWEARRVRHKA